jgi:hypothetical protein
MGKRSKRFGSDSGSASSGNGGVLGSGIFGMFGTTIKCDSTDNSYYCNFMKFFNVLVVVLFIVFLLYYVKMFVFDGGKRGR